MAIGTFGIILYLYRSYNFFQRHGVVYIPSVPVFGVLAPVIFQRISFPDFTRKIYNFDPDAKYLGFYSMTTPTILLRDLELIKTVFVKNFQSFPYRPNLSDSSDFLIQQSLFELHGEKWRNVRSLLGLSFTSSKMKNIFALMSECAVNFTKSLSTLPVDKSDFDVKDLFTKYANDVMTMYIYGIKIDSVKDPTNKFYSCAKEATCISGIRIAKLILLRTFPKFYRMFNIRLLNNRVSSFFKNIIKTRATDDADHMTRTDLIQLMLNIKDKEDRRKLNNDDIAAQAFNFLFGGLETTSTTLSFAAHEIASNLEIQIKLQREIDDVLAKSNYDEVNYEIINNLPYLDAVVKEVLRFYPPSIVERVCDKDYELPAASPGEKPFVMKKGMICWVPVFAIHHDEKYYDNPDRFQPERFLDKAYRNSFSFMPFGVGPRICIGQRFAMLQMKLVLFYLLALYELKPCAKTTLPLRFSKKNMAMISESGFWLNIQRKNNFIIR